MAEWERGGVVAEQTSDGWERGSAVTDQATSGWERGKTKLFSLEGVTSTLRLVGPSIARGVLGAQLMGLEEVQNARVMKRQNEGDFPQTPDEIETIRRIGELRAAIAESSKDIKEKAGNPTYPLQLAQGVVTSVAQNAPGISAAVLTRQAGPAAAAPALMNADVMASGSSYAESAVDKGASVPNALTNARVHGAAEAAFELMPVGYLVNRLGKDGFSEFMKNYVLKEWATELPTTLTHNISDWATVDQAMPVGKFIHKTLGDLLDTAITAPIAASVTGSGARGIALAGRLEQEKIWERGISVLDSPIQPPAAPPPLVSDAELLGSKLPEFLPQVKSPAPVQVTAPVDPKTRALLDQIDKELSAAPATPAELAQAEQEIAAHKASLIPQAPQGIEALQEIDDLNRAPTPELDQTSKKVGNQYLNENDDVPRSQRPIMFGPEGMTRTRIRGQMPAGTYTIGVETADRPTAYARALHDTMEEWRQKFMPDAVFVLASESVPVGSALGWHHKLSSGAHYFVTPPLRSMKDSKTFEPKTQFAIFMNLAHEFTHSLVRDRFFEGVQPELAAQIIKQSELGIVDEALIAQLPEIQAGVIREFNEKKARILSDEMTAGEFLLSWMNPAKMARDTFLSEYGTLAELPVSDLINKIIGRAQRENRTLSVSQLRQLRSQYTGLDEYLAEQGARYAYLRKWDQASKLNTPDFFQRAFTNIRDKLTQFFKFLKAEGLIAPGVKFQEWMDGLSGYTPSNVRPGKKGTKPLTEKAKKAKATKAKAPKTKSKSPKADTRAGLAPPPADHNVNTADTETAADLRKILTNAVRNKAIEAGSDEYKELMDLIKSGDTVTFHERMQPYLEKRVRYELDFDIDSIVNQNLKTYFAIHAAYPISEWRAMDPEVQRIAAAEWKAKGFASRFFKAWFGDWQNDPANASKVVTANGDPLVVFHSSPVIDAARAVFDTFKFGDIGFHFGTVRAAHVRGLDLAPNPEIADMDRVYQVMENQMEVAEKSDDPDAIDRFFIIPAVMSLRNPFNLGDENKYFWTAPEAALRILQLRGVITTAEEAATKALVPAVYGDQYQRFAPVRDLLKSKGYDGIIYNNKVEGDTSYVAFDPEQIKTMLGNKVFSRSPRIDFELDFDLSKPDGVTAATFRNKFKRFIGDYGPISRAFRHVTNMQWKVFQLQQLAHIHPELIELDAMLAKNGEFERYGSFLMENVSRLGYEWGDLGKENYARVANFLQAESDGGRHWADLKQAPDGTWTYVPNAEFVERLKEFKIDTTTDAGQEVAELILKVKNSFLQHINELKSVMMYLLGTRYQGASMITLKAYMKVLNDKIATLRQQPFFPTGHFGNNVIVVRRRNAQGKLETVYRAHFENLQEWAETFESMRGRLLPGEIIEKRQLTETEYVLMALPLDFVELAASELGLADAQVEQLMAILQPVKLEKGFSRFDRSRLKIKGGSGDHLRNYTNFMWHNANMLAKLRYRKEFASIIESATLKLSRAAKANTSESLLEVEKLTKAVNFMKRTRDFILFPPNEAHGVRTFVSLVYLAGAVKTAVMNLSGFMMTWSSIISDLGAKDGTALFLKATTAALSTIYPVDLTQMNQGVLLSPETRQALERATKEGVLHQSYAYHVAGMANSSNLDRLPGQRVLGKVSQHSIDVLMWLFRLMELFVRRATFIARFEIAQQKAKSDSLVSPYEEAVKTTNALQNDYSRGNRPAFLRGIKTQSGNKLAEAAIPAATIFMSFTQHASFHAYGGYELGNRRRARLAGEKPKPIFMGYTMKLLILYFILAGYEGLPGMENFLDILDSLWKKYFHRPVREEMRELVQSVGVDPVWASHGLGHNVAGFDVSRSIGLGRIVPGTDVLSKSSNNFDQAMGAFIFNALGPSGNMLHWMLQTGFDNKPIEQNLQRAPGALGNITTAYYWSKHGVRSPLGTILTKDPATGALRDLTTAEILGRAAGFNPTIVSQEREIRAEQHDARMYWVTRRDRLMDDLWRAKYQNDREAIADVNKAIIKYNEAVPKEAGSKLRITSKDIHESMAARRRNLRRDQAGKAPQKRYDQLYETTRESFDSP